MYICLFCKKKAPRHALERDTLTRAREIRLCESCDGPCVPVKEYPDFLEKSIEIISQRTYRIPKLGAF